MSVWTVKAGGKLGGSGAGLRSVLVVVARVALFAAGGAAEAEPAADSALERFLDFALLVGDARPDTLLVGDAARLGSREAEAVPSGRRVGFAITGE